MDAAGILMSARKIANLASAEGLAIQTSIKRPSCIHLGAVLADSVLQAGLSYSSVVRPRIDRILSNYPEATTTNALIEIVQKDRTPEFLSWNHPTKTTRFNRVVLHLNNTRVSDANTLRESLHEAKFRDSLLQINGIGPKTIDYMACLLGIESIAVDRHIKAFARKAGIESTEYDQLKKMFCFAADLLSVPRRDFDAWIWQHESNTRSSQMTFAI